MKVCESKVYKHIGRLWTRIAHAFFEETGILICCHQNVYKTSEGKNPIQSHSFHNPPATQEIKL